MATRTITLTDRPPIRIDEDNWPLVASSQDKEHDGQVECQANQKSYWNLRVRQHEDGRAIVYATYDYTSNWQGARDYSAKHGVLLPVGTTAEAIVSAINDVSETMSGCEHHGDDSARWATLADECIADMPAEELN
jgi:hypothetical protein